VVPLEAFVSPDITYELMIGTDFFINNNININFHTKTLNFVHPARLRMAHTITIKPYSVTTVYTVLTKMPPGEQLIFIPTGHWIHQGILMPKILIQADLTKPYIPLKISNITNNSVKLRLGRVLGLLVPLFCFEHPVGLLPCDPPYALQADTTVTVNSVKIKVTPSENDFKEFAQYFDFSKSCLSAEQIQKLLVLLYDYKDLFVKKGETLRMTKWT
jgi:hypothetical protein